MTIQETLTQYRQQLQTRIGVSLMQPLRAIIGNPITSEIYATSTNLPDGALVFIHLQGEDPQSFTTALRGVLTSKDIFYGRPVLVKYNDSGIYEIDRLDAAQDAIFADGIDTLHSQDPVYLNQLQYGTLHPVANEIQLLALGAMYGNEWVSDQYTADFSSGTVQDTAGANITAPVTNGQAKGILVQVSPRTGTLSYKQSSEFSNLLSLAQAYKAALLPAVDAGLDRVGYFKWAFGTTQIAYDHIWEVNEALSNSQQKWGFPETVTGTYVVPSGIYQTTSDYTIANGANLIIEGTLLIL